MDTYLGEFEPLVLLAVLRVGEDAYAVPVRAEIESRAGRVVSRGALYTTLDRLEQKGLLRSRLGDPLPERGGRARRYYAVSARGLASLRAARESIDGLSAGVTLEPKRAPG
jgi:PadR family transcriptional regulator, regulatory protein PadR